MVPIKKIKIDVVFGPKLVKIALFLNLKCYSTKTSITQPNLMIFQKNKDFQKTY